MRNLLLPLLLCVLSLTYGQQYVKGEVYVKINQEDNESFLYEAKGDNGFEIKGLRIEPFADDQYWSKMAAKGQDKPKHGIDQLYRFYFDTRLNVEDVCFLLSEDPRIKIASPIPVAELFYQPNDLLADSLLPAANGQNQLILHNFYRAWEVEKGDTSIVIGVTDTGILYSHEEMKDNLQLNVQDTIDGINNDGDTYFGTELTDNYRGWDMANEDNDASISGSVHGHYVASLCSATPDNTVGIAGTGFYCRYVPIKVVYDSLPNSVTHGFDGLYYAATHGMQVINASWGLSFDPGEVFSDLINTITDDLDAVIVAAAGNTGTEIKYYPASYENVLSVAAANWDTTMWYASSYNRMVDLSASGATVIVAGTGSDVDYQNSEGTSMAAPVVSGGIGLLRSHFPTWSAREIMQQARVSGFKHDSMLTDSKYYESVGYVFDPYRALTDTTIPGLWKTNHDLGDHADLMFDGENGDTITITFDLINYLHPTTSAAEILISGGNAEYTIIDSIINLGVVNRSQTSLNHSTRIFIPSTDSSEIDLNVRLGYSDDVYEDYQYIEEVLSKKLITGMQTDSNTVFSADVTVYPNPVDSEIRFTSNKELVNCSVKIMDAQGHELYESSISGTITEHSFPISGLSLKAGQYYLILTGSGYSVTKPFVKR